MAGMYSFVALARIRLDLDHAVAVLAAAAGLLGMLHVRLGIFGDRFAIGNLGLAHIGIDVEFAGQAVNDDFQMQYAHAGNQGLVGFLVALDAEGRIFLGQLVQGSGKGVAVGLGLGLDGNFDNRFRNI